FQGGPLRGLGHYYPSGGKERVPVDCLERFPQEGRAVRRVYYYKVELFAFSAELFQRGLDCALEHSRLSAAGLHIFSDDRYRLDAAVNESCLKRAPAQRLTAHGAGNGKQLEHAFKGELPREDIEYRFPDLVGGRPYVHPLEGGQPLSLAPA